LVIDKSAAGLTVVLAVAVLFAVFGSNSLLFTLALLVITSTTVGLTTILTVAVAPLARFPTLQVTVPPDRVQLPWLGVAETKATLEGNVSVTSTPVASDGPLLVTVSV
jgi:hypothetical protein